MAEPQTLSSTPDTTCNSLFPSWTAPRIAAGGPGSADVMKCTLKPVNPADYSVPFTPDQLNRLRAIFPTGVCDWT